MIGRQQYGNNDVASTNRRLRKDQNESLHIRTDFMAIFSYHGQVNW